MMLLDIYLWLWPQMQIRHLLKQAGYWLGLTLLFIGPLLYMNIDLIRQGYKPSQVGLTIEADRGSQGSGINYLPPEEE